MSNKLLDLLFYGLITVLIIIDVSVLVYALVQLLHI